MTTRVHLNNNIFLLKIEKFKKKNKKQKKGKGWRWPRATLGGHWGWRGATPSFFFEI
jgi:hypothetical protein